jgi:transcriptional regulator with XRE-family HTH domain
MINEDALYVRIGAQLKAIRTNSSNRQLTQEKLASIVGLERTSITNIEAGKQRLPLHVLYELCNALGVEVSEVLPPYNSIADSPQKEAVQIGDKSLELTSQIANLVRAAK